MVDNIPNIRLLVTGSGSFDLLQKIGEPLVGRKYTYQLFPISVYELKKNLSVFDLSTRLEKFLIYGMYPDVLTATTKHERRQNLKEIAESYLFKDLLIFEGLKNSAKLLKLLKLLAFQIGSEVSLTELGNSLDIDKKTVARYLDLLEKTYIITPLTPYFINRRQSVIKKHKYYFLDTGIRNALIDDLRPLNTRTDIGQLWENFLVVERLKKQAYTPIYGSNYFWRTWAGQEIDWVEMRDGKLYGFEFKWGLPTPNPNKSSWLKAYPKEASYQLVNQKNYLDFIT